MIPSQHQQICINSLLLLKMSHFLKLSQLLEHQLTQKGTHIYLLRHGQSLANHAGSIIGWTDSKLSVKGREQANKLFRSFHPHIHKFTHLHCSDLTRTKDTLNLALGFPSKPLSISPELRELNFGDDEGVHFDSLPAQQKAIVNSINYQAPNGENWVQAKQRAMGYLSKLPEGHHLIGSHGGLICSLNHHLGLKHVVPNCSLVAVELCPATRQLHKLNFLWEFQQN